jgi:hypothetical protein
VRSSSGGSVFSYDSHYCTIDRPTDPTTLACSWISSGIRVFDVRDLDNVREIAYYNPPAQKGKNLQLTNSAHAVASVAGIPLFDFLPMATSILAGKFNPGEAIGPRTAMVAFGDLSSDWCLAPAEFHGSQLWTSCSDSGFMVLQLDNNVYHPPADQDSTLGS